MRKKSHISLAKYLLNSAGMEALQKHKKAFYVGSILPDCVPSFITRRHSIEETFAVLRDEICKITENYKVEKGAGSYYCRHLGVITHYVADYFTFPHNEIFSGSIKEHCIYEKHLKHALKEYVNSDTAQRIREKMRIFHSVDELLAYIWTMHAEYLKAIKEVGIDCHYIVELSHKVVDAILQFLEYSLHEKQLYTKGCSQG
ncbi:zinc dependent phospholipase C family protein [Anaeromicropila populeti]|uniref:Zinc dependent phospholipase C n=1 Tax=Anaeromicropila populeti TaxID=37658 RepID=A0A1I6JDI6_9FIRM|nr:zinc dependent phospholipase C family protein [Anaeromicropila populeti]SFR77031.1 Zinc dependent phospholipase C [Anaeromicropila populeti]